VRRVDRVLTILGTWTFDPVLGFGLIACACAYLQGLRILTRRGQSPGWPRRYTVCFLGGLALTWFVLLGPIGAYDDIFFWAHMTQHLAIMMVAAPLLVLGAPVLLLLRVSSRQFRRRRLVPILRSRAVAAVTHPVVGWLVFAGVLVGTHFSPFYDFALQHPLVHRYVEHPLYLGAALVYYYPLLSPTPAPRRVHYWLRVVSLSLMMVPEAMSGFFIYASSYLLYPYYGSVSRPFGPGPLEDQQFGGALMWAGSMIIDSIWVAIAVHEWLRSEERLAHQIDLATLAQATLPAGRAQ
jgi:cytochrome c oxidase assembly factor CtaG